MSAGARLGALRVLAPLAMMALIFVFSGHPEVNPDFAWWEVVLRKLGHASGYAALTGLWWWALRGRARHPLAWAVAISLAYAVSDEYHQTFVEGRHGTPIDVLVDAVGVAAASTAIRIRKAHCLRGRNCPGEEEAAGPRSSRGRSR